VKLLANRIRFGEVPLAPQLDAALEKLLSFCVIRSSSL
jgi:hypothetical protein